MINIVYCAFWDILYPVDGHKYRVSNFPIHSKELNSEGLEFFMSK